MNLIDKIKELFESQTHKFLDAKLVDGTIVRVDADAFKPGDKLSFITESGEVVQAPEGMHELEDGTVLVVDIEGKITEVRKPEEVVNEEASNFNVTVEVELSENGEDVVINEVPQEEMEEPMAPTIEERVAVLEEAVTKMVLLVEQLITKIDEKKEETEIEVEGEMKKLNEELSKLKEENESLKKSPATEPVKFKKVDESESSDNNKYARISNILAKNKK